MPLQMQIGGWKSEGLRCPDHEVSFEKKDGTVHPISLIQMPNGTGKTTTLELLRAILSGAILDDEWNRDKIMSFRKRGSRSTFGVFQIVLLYGEGRRFTLTCNFDFSDGTVKLLTTRWDKGVTDAFLPPPEIKKFLTKDFVKFYVFDGELAEQLLDKMHTNAETAIVNLFQLNLFKGVMNRINEFWERATVNRTAKDEKGLTQRYSLVRAIKNRIETLKNEFTKKENQLDDINQLLQDKQNKYTIRIKEHEEYRKRLDAAEDEFNQAQRYLDGQIGNILLSMRRPQSLSNKFAQMAVNLKNNLDKVKLPESAAREFFEELADENECVCGRPMDESAKIAVRERAQKYMGSDDVALLNALKSDIATFIGDDSTFHETELNNEISDLTAAIDKFNMSRTECDAIEAEVINADPELEEAKDKINELKLRLNKLELEIEKYKEDNYDGRVDLQALKTIYCIKYLENKLENAEERLAEIAETIELKVKRDYLKEIFEVSFKRAHEKISSEICKETNARIKMLMPFSAIRLKEIKRSLVLEGQEGGSVGETLSVSYAFLSTLFNRTEHMLPFVVDSPANPIDLDVRDEVGKLIPKLTHQFIAFMISSERDRFLDAIEKISGDAIQYITLFKKGNREIEDMATKESDYLEAVDGLCVKGRGFFMNFQVDVEDNE